MPQLDPTYFPSQLVWLAISFTLLFVLLKFWALPPVSELLDKRQKTIDDDLNLASKHEKEIEEITKKCEIVLRKSKQESHDFLLQKMDEIKNYNQEKEKELAVKLNLHLKNTEIKVEKAKEDAMGDIEKLVVNLSVDLAERLIGSKFSQDIASQTVQEALKSQKGRA